MVTAGNLSCCRSWQVAAIATAEVRKKRRYRRMDGIIVQGLAALAGPGAWGGGLASLGPPEVGRSVAARAPTPNPEPPTPNPALVEGDVAGGFEVAVIFVFLFCETYFAGREDDLNFSGDGEQMRRISDLDETPVHLLVDGGDWEGIGEAGGMSLQSHHVGGVFVEQNPSSLGWIELLIVLPIEFASIRR